MNQKVIIILSVVIMGLGGAWFLFGAPRGYSNISSYEDCVAAGYPVLETYPEQCKTPDGRTFTRTVETNTFALNKALTLRMGETATFSNGLSITLKEINDSRCPSGVQCIWQGEISALFAVNFTNNSEEVRLGTVTKKSAVISGHTIMLQSGTAEDVTIVVSSTVSKGGITGSVHLGPTCPVERIPPDSNCADKPYANAKIVVRNKATGSLVVESVTNAAGNFHIDLAPGTYTIIAGEGKLLPRCDQEEVTIKGSEVINLDISCDSGIR